VILVVLILLPIIKASLGSFMGGRRRGREQREVGIEGERTEMVDCPGYSSFFLWPVLEHQQAWVVSSGLGRQHQDRVLLNFLTMNVAGTGCDWVNHVSYGRSARCGLAFACFTSQTGRAIEVVDGRL
jgi:hypothetical protein